MELHFSDEYFVYGKTSVRGFPIVVNKFGEIVEPALMFLVSLLLNSGKRLSIDTWKSYGQAIYDYFLYLESKQIDWDENSLPGSPSPVVGYRASALVEAGNCIATVNYRLRIIVRFYKWALGDGRISNLPFSIEEVRSYRRNDSMSFGERKKVFSSDVLFREPGRKIKSLTVTQLVNLVNFLAAGEMSKTHSLMVRVFLETGMRRREVIDFPADRVVDTAGIRGDIVKVTLDSSEVRIKNNKSRVIDMPKSLMDKLWQYKIFERPGLVAGLSGQKSLFVTSRGDKFSESGCYKIFKILTLRLGFHMHPHMMRHTYATHWLSGVEASKRSYALPILQRQLGHADINVTIKYLSFLNEVAEAGMSKYQDYITNLFQDVDYACS